MMMRIILIIEIVVIIIIMIIIMMMMMMMMVMMMMMMMMMMIIIIALKDAVRDFLQSSHCAANCLQHVRSSGPGAVVYRSRTTCSVPLGTKGQLSYQV